MLSQLVRFYLYNIRDGHLVASHTLASFDASRGHAKSPLDLRR